VCVRGLGGFWENYSEERDSASGKARNGGGEVIGAWKEVGTIDKRGGSLPGRLKEKGKNTFIQRLPDFISFKIESGNHEGTYLGGQSVIEPGVGIIHTKNCYGPYLPMIGQRLRLGGVKKGSGTKKMPGIGRRRLLETRKKTSFLLGLASGPLRLAAEREG